MEYYIAVKRNEEDLYKVVWSDFQDTLLSEICTGQRVSVICYPLCKTDGIRRYSHVYSFVQKKDKTRH